MSTEVMTPAEVAQKLLELLQLHFKYIEVHAHFASTSGVLELRFENGYYDPKFRALAQALGADLKGRQS